MQAVRMPHRHGGGGMKPALLVDVGRNCSVGVRKVSGRGHCALALREPGASAAGAMRMRESAARRVNRPSRRWSAAASERHRRRAVQPGC